MSVKCSKKFKTQLKKTVASTITAVAVLVLVLVCLNVNKQTKNEVVTLNFFNENKADNVFETGLDEYIYVDANEGNDSTGDGTRENPFKTLAKVKSSGLVVQNKTYGIILGDGTYDLTTAMFELNNNKSVHILGNRQNTELKVAGIYANSSGGSTSYTLNFYRLVWHGTSAPANAIFPKTKMNFYNVALKFDFSAASYGYFIPAGQMRMYNCTMTRNVTSFLRTTQTTDAIKLTNCYGGFTSGYSTSNGNWNYQTNYITSNPQVNSSTYEITDAESVWKDVGTGVDTDGSQADLGVYGGTYGWNYNFGTKAYTIKEKKAIVKIGKTYQIQITESTGADENPDESKWTWTTSDPSVVTIDSNGLVTGLAIGRTIITGVNEEEDSRVTCTVSVYEPKKIVDLGLDEFIYVDAARGDDTTGDGSQQKPFKTLARIKSSGIIDLNKSYGVFLGNGTYDLTTAMYELNCNKSIHIFGNCQNTQLNVPAIYANSGGGSSAYTLNFYRLVWYGTSNAANAVYPNTKTNFYNVAFKFSFSGATYGYFIPAGQMRMYNCTMSQYVTSFFRGTQTSDAIKLTNCYGGFTSGYGTSDASWNYQTNYITSSPAVNPSNYQILEADNIWVDVGTGQDLDATQADLGVYGGEYRWGTEFNLSSYMIKEKYHYLRTGDEYQIAIGEASGEVEDPDESEWTWTSSNPSIATVDGNGLVKGISNGNTIITGWNAAKESEVKCEIRVYKEKVFFVDQAIYVDAINGNDTNGDGSKTAPFKTLPKVASSGIIVQDKSYAIILGDGSYDLTTAMFTLNCNDSIHIFGNYQNTDLRVSAIYPNSRGGSTAYSLNFYQLKWRPIAYDSNTIFQLNKMNLYNVLFDFSVDGTSDYFIPAGQVRMYNCTLPKNVTGLFRVDQCTDAIKLTNCYGGFTSGYATTDANWNYQTNYITSSPKTEPYTYVITDTASVWKNVGTGKDYDDSTADLGVYGGEYGWGTTVELRMNKYYTANYKNEYIKVGQKVKIEITELSEPSVNQDEREWDWASSNTDVITVDGKGEVTAKKPGTATITGTNQEGKKVKVIFNVYRNVNNAITVPDIRIGTQSNGYTVVLKEDGTVWASGLNSSGQLGQGNTTNTSVPVQVKIDENTYLTNVRKIVVGYHAVAAMTVDGNVYAWGNNENGKLGVGDTSNKVYATKLPGVGGEGDLEDIIDISLSRNNIFALDKNGDLYGAGKTGNGLFSNSTTTTMIRLPKVSGAICIKSDWEMMGVMCSNARTFTWGNIPSLNYIGDDIAVLEVGGGGSGYISVIKEDQSVWGYGDNSWGWFGTATASYGSFTQLTYSDGTPIQAKQIKASVCHYAFLNTQNKLYAAGYNPFGQLSNGTTTEKIASFTEMTYSDGSSVTDSIAISAGDGHDASGIIRNNGEVWISGNNVNGELGNGTNTNSSYFTKFGNTYLNYQKKNIVIGVNESITLSRNDFKIQEFNVFADYQPKNAGTLTYSTEDTNIELASNGKITGLAEGFAKVTVTDTDNNISTTIIVKVVRDKNMALEIGETFSMGLTTSGQVWTWGSNIYGELGQGTDVYYIDEPARITSLSNVVDIGAGKYHAVALDKNGNVYTWGLNNAGQLGNGTNTNSKSPVQITGLSNIVKVDAYKNTTTALDSNGNLYIWGEGYDTTPQLVLTGIIDFSDDVIITKDRRVKRINENVFITGAENAIEVSASEDRIIILKADGTLLNVDTNHATTNLSVANTVQVSAGNGYGYILNKNQEVYTYGTAVDGELGNGANTAVANPTKVSLENIELVSAGEGKTGGVANFEGYMYTTGKNDYGQLGHDDLEPKNIFEVILNVKIESNVDKVIKKVGESEIVDIGLGINLNLKKDLQEDTTSEITIVDDSIAELIKVGPLYKVTGKTIGRTFLNATVTGNIRGEEKQFAVNIEVRIVPEGGIVVPQIKSGQDFTIALKADGTVESWGANEFGQLGIGSTEDYDEPRKIETITQTVVEVSAGDSHAIALTENGKVYGWGLNNNGQVGNGTTTNQVFPIVVLDSNGNELEKIIRIEAHKNNSFAITEDGEVYAWGKDYGSKARKLESLENIIDVSSSYYLKADGTVYRMGNQEKITMVSRVRSIDEGSDHAVFLAVDGKVFAIGENDFGQLGNGSTDVTSNEIVAMRRDSENLLENIVAVDAGDRYTILLTNNGDVYTTGLNADGRLGIDKETMNILIPRKNENIQNAFLISAGNEHAVVALTNGETYAWGKGDQGALGNRRLKDSVTPEMVGSYVVRANNNHITLGKTDNFVLKAKTDYFNIISEPKISMTAISKNTQVARVSSLDITNLTLDEAAEGYSAFKVQGIKEGTTNIVLTEEKTNSNGILQVEVLPVAGTTISPMVETNANHILTLKTNGTVWAYGNNAYGQLGIGSLENIDEPQQVIFENTTGNSSQEGEEPAPVIIKQIASGEYHSVALDTEGNVWTWGRNNYSQLGMSSGEYSNKPVKVTGIPKVTRITAGNNSVMAITESNKLIAWGQNTNGELGTGTYTNRILPTQVNGMHDVLDIQGGKSHYLVLKTTGELFTVGSNLYNQLGIDLGERTRTGTFEKIDMNVKFGSIATEHSSNAAITVDGVAYIWGQNSTSNLGGSSQNIKLPTQIQGVNGVVEVDLGKTNTILRDYNNNIYIVGQNKYGQIGNGTTDAVSTYTKSNAIDDVLRVSTGNTYTAVMKTDGTVWAWGDYNHGSKILKSRTNSKVPVQIGSDTSSLDKLEIIVKKSETASILANSQFRFNLIYEDENATSDFTYESLNTDIAIVNNEGTILGVREGTTWVKVIDTETGKVNVAIIRVIDNVEGYNVYAAPKIRTGENFAVTLKEDGNIDIWGYDISQMVDSDVPYTINVVETYVNIESGKNHVIALRNDGTVWTVGDNSYGQLGIGSNVTNTKLVQIPGLTDIEKIAAGDNFGVAMDSYGIIYAWGEGYGTLPVVLNTNIREASYLAAGGRDQILLILPSGEIYGFGSMLNGILPDFNKAVKVEVGSDYLLILDTDGKVHQYKNGVLSSIDLISSAVDISASGNTRMYQNVNESVFSWGANTYSQAGLDNTYLTPLPVKPANNAENVFTMAAGNNNTYIVDTNGYVYSAGDNSLGQIGNGTKEDTTSATYGKATTHTIVGGRNFEIDPEEAIMEVNDVEELKIKGNTYNVFERLQQKRPSEFNFLSNDSTIVELQKEGNEPTGSIKALTEGQTTIDITDKITGETKTITRKVVPLNQNRIKIITADGNEAAGTTPSDEVKYIFGYKTEVAMDDDQELVTISIITNDTTDSISIDKDNKQFTPNGRLEKQITFTERTMKIPVTVKTSNGTEFMYELSLYRISNNNKVSEVTVNGFTAKQSETDEDVYEIIITDLGNNEVKVIAENDNEKVSIKGQVAVSKAQTYIAVLKDGYLEVPFKVTSESGKIRNAVVKIYTEDKLLALKNVTVNGVNAEKLEDGTYRAIIDDDISRSKVYATTVSADAYVGINDSEKELKEITKTVITTLDETNTKIKVEKQAEVDGVEKTISKEYDLNIYKNRVFSMVQEVEVNGEVLEEENNVYTAYVLSSVDTANIKITAKQGGYKITFDTNVKLGILTTNKALPNTDNVFRFTVEDNDNNKKEYTLIIERGSTDTKLKKITVADDEYIVEAEETEETIDDIPIYEAKILETHDNVDVTVQTANRMSKVEVNNSGNLRDRISVENIDLEEKTTLVPILVKTEDESLSKNYYLRIIKVNDDTTLEKAFVNELLSNPDIEATVDLNDETHYEIQLESPVTEVQLTAITTNPNAQISIGEEEKQNQTAISNIDITSSITEVEVRVTSEAGTEKVYTISIYTISDDTTLESVTVNGTEAVWNRAKNRYEIKVDRDLLGYEVTATTIIDNAKVSVAGTEAVHTVTKQVTNETDETLVKIVTTAENTITSETRYLAIIEKSDNKELGYVKINGKALAPDGQGNYNIEVVSTVKSVLIEVGAQDGNATINLDGEEMTGVWKKSKTLASNDELYDVYIVAEDGKTVGNTFKINIIRLDGNTEIDSMEVTYTKRGVDGTKEPEKIDNDTYYVRIPRVEDNRIALRIVLEQAKSKVNVLGTEDKGSIYGYVNLTGERTVIPIVILAEDGTRSEKTLIVEKESIDTTLKQISAQDCTVYKVLSDYYVEVDSKADKMLLSAVPNSPYAKVKIVDETDYESTIDNVEVNITGKNTITLEVIAEDGETTQQHTINIIRAYNTSLETITVNGTQAILDDSTAVNIIETADNTAELIVRAKNSDAEIYVIKDSTEIDAEIGTLTTDIDIDEEQIYTYIIKVKGPGEYSSYEHDYTLKVRKKSANVGATIKLDNEDITYNSETEQYEAKVVNGVHTLDVIPESAYATVEIEAEIRNYMYIFIEPGVTKLYRAKITSETGAEKVYKIQIYRENNDTDIKEVNIKLTSDGDEETLTQQHDGSYYKKIKRNQESVFVTLTANDVKATADIDGTQDISSVEKEIATTDEITIVPLKIIAEDGTENTVNLKIEKESNDATLKEVKYKGLVVQPENNEYLIDVDNRLVEIQIDATPTNANAKLKIVGKDTYLSTLIGENVDIEGLDYFEIEVVAEDGETTKTYKVNIRRIFNTEIEELKVDTNEEVKQVLKDYSAFVSPTADSHTIQIKPSNELAVITIYDEDDTELKTGTGTITLTDLFEENSKKYKVKVQGPTGFDEFITNYTVTLTKKSQDTSAQITINNSLIERDEETGKYKYITKLSNNTLRVETTSEYAMISIDSNDSKKHEATEIYSVNVSETKEIKIIVTSQNGESEEYNVEIIRLDNNAGIMNITVNGNNAYKVTSGLYRSAQEKNVRDAVIRIVPEFEFAFVKAETDEGTFTSSGALEFTTYLLGSGLKEVKITVVAQDGSKEEYILDIVQNTSENMNIEVEVNDVKADKIDNSSYRIFVENTNTLANVHIYAEDEYTTIDAEGTTGSDIRFNKILNTEDDITIAMFSVTNELGNTNYYMLYIIKESNDYSIKTLSVNGLELTKGDNGRYTAYIDNTGGNPTVKVKTNNEYAYARIGTNEKELQETEKVVKLSEYRTTTVPITTYSQSGIANVEYLDIVTTFAVGNIDTIIVDDVEVYEYDEATRTYTALVESNLAEHEILVVADNNYVTLELEGFTGIGSVTSIVSFEEEQEIKEMPLYITGETDLTQTYRIIIAQKSSNVELEQVKVNDVTLQEQNNYIYRKNIDLAAKNVKVEVTTKYPYAKVKVGDHETMTGASGEAWIDIEVTQDEITIPVVVTAADEHTLRTYNIILTRKASTMIGSVITDNYEGKHNANIYVYKSSDLRDIDDPDNPRELIYSTISNDDGSYVLETPYADTYDIVIKKTGYLTYTITNVQAEAYSNVYVQKVKIKAGDIDKNDEIELDDLVELNDHIGEEVTDSNRLYDLNEDGVIDIEDRKLIKANYHSKAQTVKWKNPNDVDLIKPLDDGYLLTSDYGYRVDPIDGSTSFHSGVDLVGPHHGNIYAVADGEVTWAGVQSSYGNCVEIKHIVNGETIYSFYAHMSRIDVDVGDLVEQGDVIGLEGGDQALDPNPGRTTGHHLHFEIRSASGWTNNVNPHDYLEL